MHYPSLARSTVRHVELVPLGATRLLLVMISTTGRVEQRVLELGTDLLIDDAEGTPRRPSAPSSTGPAPGAPSPRRPALLAVVAPRFFRSTRGRAVTEVVTGVLEAPWSTGA